jgi:ribonuclease P protein component
MAAATDIKKLIKKARRILKDPSLDILEAPTQQIPGSLVIITPGRIGNAVTRNRVRRRLKALFHEHGLLKKGHDIVIIVKKEGTLLTYAQLQTLILPLFHTKSS